ncbi:hypothetical protein ACFLR9_04010 [Bacteroidota bacterium]
MKIDSISMFRHLVFALLVCSVFSLKGQTLYALKIDRNIRLEAQGITARYQPRLVMGVDQALEFQSTVARFLVKNVLLSKTKICRPRLNMYY